MHKCCCHWVWVHATGGVTATAAAAGGGAGAAGGVGDCHAGSWWCLPHDVRTMRAHNSGCQTDRQAGRQTLPSRLRVCVCVACNTPPQWQLARLLAHSFMQRKSEARAHNAPPSPAASPLSICVQFWLIDSRRTHSFCLPLVNTSFRCLPQLLLPLLLLL